MLLTYYRHALFTYWQYNLAEVLEWIFVKFQISFLAYFWLNVSVFWLQVFVNVIRSYIHNQQMAVAEKV